jgi:hypothetical protein
MGMFELAVSCPHCMAENKVEMKLVGAEINKKVTHLTALLGIKSEDYRIKGEADCVCGKHIVIALTVSAIDGRRL